MQDNKRNKMVLSQRAQTLRKLGYNVTYKGNKKATPQQKSAVNKLWNQTGKLVKEQGYEFKQISKRNQRIYRNHFDDRLFTPKGMFLPLPKDAKTGKYTKVKIRTRGNNLEVDSGKKTKEILVTIDRKKLAKEGKSYVRKLQKKFSGIIGGTLSVNGYGPRNFKSDISDLENYWEELANIIKNIEDKAKLEGTRVKLPKFSLRLYKKK